jgi:competence protein ComEC
MKRWNPYPLLRLFFPFTAGILLVVYGGASIHIPAILLLILWLLNVVYTFYLTRKMPWSLRWVHGLFLYLFLFLLGYELTLSDTAALQQNHLCRNSTPGTYSVVRITAPPQIRENSVRAEAELLMSGDSNGFRSLNADLLLYFSKDTNAVKLQYGDELLLAKPPELLAESRNPEAFDYKLYLWNKGITHRLFCRSGDWRYLQRGYVNPVYTMAYTARDRILRMLADNGLAGQEYAVTAALLIGYIDKLDADLLRDYSGTGAMHILSVSGMHVGLIYAVLNMLLFFFNRYPWGKFPKAFFMLLFIWMYAVVTGLSPSVLRAASMFSIIVAGNAFSRQTDIYNSMAASAMLLLMVDPHFITDTGFQLSYVAVLGIVMLQPAISAWWSPKNWLLRQIWSITAVSIAAQIATFPMGMYYFRQFPNYFLLTNIVALPLSSAVIYLALIVLVLSFFPGISGYAGQVLSFLVMLLNGCISTIESLPGSVTRGAYVNLWQTLLIYLAIIFLLWYCYKRFKPALLAFLGVGVLIGASVLLRDIPIGKQAGIVVWDAGKYFAMDLIDGRKRLLVADSAILCNPGGIDYLSKRYVEKAGIRDFYSAACDADLCLPEMQLSKSGNLLEFHQHRIAITEKPETAQSPIQLDCLILRGKKVRYTADFLGAYHPSLVIIASSVPLWNAAILKASCDSLDLPVYSVPDGGAYVRGLPR